MFRSITGENELAKVFANSAISNVFAGLVVLERDTSLAGSYCARYYSAITINCWFASSHHKPIRTPSLSTAIAVIKHLGTTLESLYDIHDELCLWPILLFSRPHEYPYIFEGY